MIRIMIAEDEQLERHALSTILVQELSHEDVAIVEASTGLQALQEAIEQDPDIILMDIEMPEMSGLDCLSVLRSVGVVAPALILTAYSRFAYAQKAIQVGVKDYLLKPISRDELMKSITLLLPEAKMSRPPQKESRAERTVRFVKACIESHMKTSITLGEVAESAGLSTAYVSRCFRQVAGIGFKEYLTEQQVRHAKELLRSPGASVSATARAVGFSDPNYFCKVFRRCTGVTPSRFREEGCESSLRD